MVDIDEPELNTPRKSGFIKASVFFTTIGIVFMVLLSLSGGSYVGYAFAAGVLFSFLLAFATMLIALIRGERDPKKYMFICSIMGLVFLAYILYQLIYF